MHRPSTKRQLTERLDQRAFLRGFCAALERITTARLFESERGYQGQLIAELERSREQLGIEAADFLVEQEHQKRVSEHALKIRPDIIIHIPFDETRHTNRRADNFVVVELKVRATRAEARTDLRKLSRMLAHLDYGLGVFVNIGSRLTFAEEAPEAFASRLRAFAVCLDEDGRVAVAGPARTTSQQGSKKPRLPRRTQRKVRT